MKIKNKAIIIILKYNIYISNIFADKIAGIQTPYAYINRIE